MLSYLLSGVARVYAILGSFLATAHLLFFILLTPFKYGFTSQILSSRYLHKFCFRFPLYFLARPTTFDVRLLYA